MILAAASNPQQQAFIFLVCAGWVVIMVILARKDGK